MEILFALMTVAITGLLTAHALDELQTHLEASNRFAHD